MHPPRLRRLETVVLYNSRERVISWFPMVFDDLRGLRGGSSRMKAPNCMATNRKTLRAWRLACGMQSFIDKTFLPIGCIFLCAEWNSRGGKL